MDDFGSAALRRLIDEFSDSVQETHANLGDATAVVDPKRIEAVMRFLRDEVDFDKEDEDARLARVLSQVNWWLARQDITMAEDDQSRPFETVQKNYHNESRWPCLCTF